MEKNNEAIERAFWVTFQKSLMQGSKITDAIQLASSRANYIPEDIYFIYNSTTLDSEFVERYVVESFYDFLNKFFGENAKDILRGILEKISNDKNNSNRDI